MKLSTARKLQPGDRVVVGAAFARRAVEGEVIKATPRGGVLVATRYGKIWAPFWHVDRYRRVARAVQALDEDGCSHTMYWLVDTNEYVDAPPRGCRVVDD